MKKRQNKKRIPVKITFYENGKHFLSRRWSRVKTKDTAIDVWKRIDGGVVIKFTRMIRPGENTSEPIAQEKILRGKAVQVGISLSKTGFESLLLAGCALLKPKRGKSCKR